MKKLLLLTLVLVSMQASQADNDYRITIIKGDKEPKAPQLDLLTRMTPEQIDALPIAFLPVKPTSSESEEKAPTSFIVVIENTRDVESTLTMALSDWYESLSFTTLSDEKKPHPITRLMREWAKNPSNPYVFPPHGTKKIAVDFTDGTWSGLPEAPAKPTITMMTATFSYSNKSLTVSSAPTSIILMSK